MKLRLTLALLCTLGALSAQAGTITWDLNGVTVDGTNTSIVQAGAAGTITGINWDFELVPISPSWSEELVINLQGTGNFCAGTLGASFNSGDYCADLGVGPNDVDLGALDNSDPFLFVGSSTALNGLSSDGLWTLNLWDGFDDAGDDGFVAFGSIIIKFDDATPTPEPGILILMGLGLAAVGFARRRR